MFISQTNNKELIKSIITNPVLWDLRDLDDHPNDLCIPENLLWLLATEDNKNLGLIELIPFTNNTMFGHIHLLPEYHSTGLATQFIKSAQQYLKEHTQINSVLTTVPVSCTHVIRLMKATNFIQLNTIPDGIIYKNKKQDLLLYQLKVQ